MSNSNMVTAQNQVAAHYSQAGQQTGAQTPASSSLDGIRKRIDHITSIVHDMHGIADRACGAAVSADSKSAPQAVPNGMLDEIENALDILVVLSNAAVARLSRIA
jgi:hypothetical protein